ncbi:MAG: ZIP family metal transporter [Ruminococcaceae bacterium]|nr:ZIP family metal transporter [Oscillospiraceae bacterium]
MENVVVPALVATLGTWLMTALGAATVIFMKKVNQKWMNIMLGFAAGVMIAASFWSLLQPAIERAESVSTLPAWCVATVGFVCGALFIWISDKTVTLARSKLCADQASAQDRFHRVFLLILSITLHNIPEGLAVGVAFGALCHTGYSTEAFMGAVTIALGIALQNFPEGAAVSFPLRREGYSRGKSFFFGQASGMVEPIAGVIGALAVVYIESMLPFALSFAAGTMILVAVHELIPECQSNKEAHPYFATMGIVSGFALMMLLDVSLG